MGSAVSSQKKQESNSSFGKIQAKTDKSWYHPGECVSGEFYFEILQDITESQLCLTFEGNEAVNFVDSSHNKGGTDKYLKNYERLIVKQESTALSWDILTTGHYVIPFTFLLPQDIPASFFQECADEYCAYIRYKLRACLKSSKNLDIELHNDINIIIREQQKLPLQAVSEEIVTSLSNCLCSSNGSSTLRAHFEKNYYYPGEAARVFVEVDNSASKITNPLLTFFLYQELTLLNGFQSKNMSSTCAYQNQRGIDAGATSAFTLAFNMPAYRGDDHTIDTREDKWPSKSNDFHIGMETNSKLITSKYYLKVSCEIKGCMVTSPTIVCPIQIKYPDPIERSLEFPQDWNPQEIPRINIVFTTSQAGGKVKAEKDKHKMVEAQMVSSVAPEKIKEGPIEVVISGNSQRV